MIFFTIVCLVSLATSVGNFLFWRTFAEDDSFYNLIEFDDTEINSAKETGGYIVLGMIGVSGLLSLLGILINCCPRISTKRTCFRTFGCLTLPIWIANLLFGLSLLWFE